MSPKLNILALVFLIIWGVGFFIYNLIFIAHIFLVLATIVFIINVLKEK